MSDIDFAKLESRLDGKMGFKIRPFLDNWPHDQDTKCWTPPYLISLGNRKHTTARLVFAVMIGELLDTTHFVRRTCGTKFCCNPGHNKVLPRAHKGHPPKPLHVRLFNSDIEEEDETQDIRDLIEGQNLTDVDAVFNFLDGMYDRSAIEKALSDE
jgi:hypothetical protein